MPASKTRIAVAAVVVLLLAVVGGLSWQRMRPSPSAHVELSASMLPARPAVPEPSAPPASAEPAVARAPDLPASERGNAPKPDGASRSSSGSDQVDAPRNDVAAPPSFDIVRVEPSGEALLAGHGTPNGTVTLVDRGKVVAEAKSDGGGNFVMTPPALKPGDYALSLREGQGSAATESKQNVVVSVPASKQQQVVVAMAEPGRATTLLSAPPVPTPSVKAAPGRVSVAEAPPASPPNLAIRSVELENDSGLFASGIAPPGTDVRVYLNNSRVADVIAAAAGSWSFKVRKGLASGRYAVRADSLASDQSVSARVEVPFEVPAQAGAGKTTSTATTSTAMTSPTTTTSHPSTNEVAEIEARAPVQVPSANAVVDELETEIVSRGDNLWRISRKRLGHGTRYTEIYAANIAQIRDPKLVYPGQVFVLPRDR